MSRRTAITTPDLVILSLLREEPLHGYALVDRLAEREASDWVECSRPQVYYSLKKLAKLNLISPIDSEKSLGPERVCFSVTEQGERILTDELRKSTWVQQRVPNPFTTWQVLSRWLPAPERTQMLERRRLYLNAEKLKEERTLAAWAPGASVEEHRAILMVRHAVKVLSLELDHVDTLLKLTSSE